MKKLGILCALDFSPPSRAALEHATSFARADGATLHTIHVCAPPVMFEGGPQPATRELEEKVREHAGESLRAMIAGRSDRSVRVEPVLASGVAAEEIVRAAARLRADLVVVGSGSRTGLQRLLMGSVAERVVRTSAVDVVVVPAAAGNAPVAAIRAVLCAVDFSPASDAALVSAVDLARRHGAELHIVHAWQPSAYSARSSDLAASYDRDVSRDLEALARRAGAAELPVACHVRRGIPYLEVVALAAELRVDLVVTGTAGRVGVDRFMLGSVAERIVRASEVPVLTVRAGRARDRSRIVNRAPASAP